MIIRLLVVLLFLLTGCSWWQATGKDAAKDAAKCLSNCAAKCLQQAIDKCREDRRCQTTD